MESGEWKKCISKSRKREYYFNTKSGKSVWTFEETQIKEKTDPKKDNKKEVAKKQINTKKSQSPTWTKRNLASSDTDELTSKRIKSKDTRKTNLKKVETCDEEPEPMEIDDIIENIQKIRTNSKQCASKIEDSKLRDLSSTDLDPNYAKNKMIVVLDTNVLLSNLKSIEKNFTDDWKKLVFVIPWIVIQELDNCKSKVYSININKRAQQAIKCIHGILLSKPLKKLMSLNTSFIFENSVQSDEVSNLISCSSNDDKILKCALQYHTKFSESEIILVTNDKNLINKALIYKIKSSCFEDFLLNFHGIENKLAIKKNQNKRALGKGEAKETTDKTNEIIMVQDDILDQGKVNKLGNKNNQNKRALETVEATANTNEIIMGQDGILDQGHFRSSNNLVYIKSSKLFLAKLLNFIEREILLNIEKLRSVLIDTNRERSLPMENLIVEMHNNFQSLLGSNEENFQKLSECFAPMRTEAKSYDTVNRFFSNNEFNSLEKLKSILGISTSIIGIFEIFQRSEYESAFSLEKINKSSDILNCMKYYNKNGSRMCSLYRLTEQFDFCNEKNLEITSSLLESQLFQPIWEIFHNKSLIIESLLAKTITLDNIKSDPDLFYQLNMCHISVEYFYRFYSNYFEAKTLKNLVNLAFAVYIMYKIFPIDCATEIETNEEFQKYQVVMTSLNWSFRTDNRELMLNGLNQLDQFKNKYQKVNLRPVFVK